MKKKPSENSIGIDSPCDGEVIGNGQARVGETILAVREWLYGRVMI